jgi:hypothetical protein
MYSESEQLPITSSVEPAWAAEAQECYRDVLQIVCEANIPYAIGGAFAFHTHTGIWRWTKDLDLFMVSGAVPRALHGLRTGGFETHIEDPVWLAKARRGEYYIDLITGMGNGCLMVETSWIERSLRGSILGIECNVLRAEELIASKLFVTRRERFDGADVVHLIRVCGRNLQWDRLLELTAEHWELLFWALVLFAYVYPAHTDIVPERVWSGLMQRFSGCIQQPSPSAPFRGSLIDPNMFAIDVDEWGERDLYSESRRPLLQEADSITEKEA